jgi:2-hydroxychromene-2-carboxylate isomerase
MAPKKPPRWYFSLRSPYSWFAYRDLVERYPDVADAVEWAPFFEPDPQTEAALDSVGARLEVVPMSRAKYFYILQDVRRLTQARGWDVTWPVDRAPHWEVAHLAYLLAADAGRGREFIDQVYRARWERGLDISDRGTIGEIATTMGLDGPRLANACDDEDVRRRGVECLVACFKDGLFGVPFFVYGRDKYFGIDRLVPFVAAVRGGQPQDDARPLPEPAGVALLSAPRADTGPAGGCG